MLDQLGSDHDVRPAAPAPARGARHRSWTTRRWLQVGVSVALVVLVLLGILGVWVFARATHVNEQLVDRSTPALINAVRLESGLVDQETGIRGYGLTGQRSFLEPYQKGIDTQERAIVRLREVTTGDAAAAADLAEVLRLAEQWQSRIARPIAALPPGRQAEFAARQSEPGKQLFDDLRQALTTQQTHLQATRNQNREELRAVDGLRNVVFIAIAGIILLLAGLVFAGLRRGVTDPLERLSRDVERVAGGEFDHAISPSGPADLRRLAEIVEQMRRRLASEIHDKETAHLALDAQAADLRRSNSELEQFAYVASHDLQEPLRKVASFCQLLQRRYAPQLDERAGQYIEFAVDGANRMQTLINDLLAFSRVGRLHAGHAPVDLERVLAQTLDSLSIAIEESGAEVSHDPLPTVTGDATQLGMLLQNLVSNAIKFRSPDRAPRIRVEAVLDGATWRMAVSDNGIGIDPDFVQKVFVIFQRLHTRDAYPGNGIGLAMCKKIVEFHHGTIEVDPDHSPGTRLAFTLPVLPQEAPAPAAEEATA
jgi:signal transduction histidine kinase